MDLRSIAHPSFLVETFPKNMDIPGHISWPSPSPFLSACDFLLWGCLKRSVFGTRSAYLRDLELRVSEERTVMSPVSFCLNCVGNELMHLYITHTNSPSISVSSIEPHFLFSKQGRNKVTNTNSKDCTKHFDIKRSTQRTNHKNEKIFHSVNPSSSSLSSRKKLQILE